MSLRETLVDELIRLRQATKVAKGGRPAVLGFFRQQLQEGENIQESVEREVPQETVRQPVRQQIVRRPAQLEIPRVPLPKMIEERIGRFRPMPIRTSVAKVLESYGQYIESSTPSKPKKKTEQQESPYEEEEEPQTRGFQYSEIRTRKAKMLQKGMVEL